MPESAAEYSRKKYTVSLLGTAYLLFLLAIFLLSGFSSDLLLWVTRLTGPSWLIMPAYLLVVSLLYALLDLPLSLYGSFYLEHRFSLSRQKLSAWFADQLKSGLLSYLFSLIILAVFYYLTQAFEEIWWVMMSVFWIFFSLVLTKVLPVFIIPLFFKYKKLSDEPLKKRIFALAQEMHVALLDVFEIDLSKKSLKANAAFVGTGRTRRVILADTLKDKYTQDEVIAIMAHELAHYKRRHLIKLMCMNACVIAALFFIIHLTSLQVLRSFGFYSVGDLAALPVVLVYFVLFGLVTGPLENWISRKMEREADLLALTVTRNPAAFISMMEKLAAQNLADRNPHFLIKLFFFDHPPVDERIALARSFVNNA